MRAHHLRFPILLLLALTLAPISAFPDDAARGAGARTPYYLPHMTWDEVEQYLRTSDIVIIPVGSLEQHGRHLPLNSDIVQGTEICLRIGQQAKVVVAPSVLAGISEHHMSFPGTIALSPATFEAVLYETAQSLVAHGFRRFIVYSGHGGNYTSVSNVVTRINRETAATAVDLLRVEFPAPDPKITGLKSDSHAGVEETSMRLLLAPGLVQMAKAENPTLTCGPDVQAIMDKTSGSDQAVLLDSVLYLPEKTGKHTATRAITNNGVVTGGDVKTATVELGQLAVDYRVAGVVRLIESWRKVRP
jgi:creatinine amidohydrolase